MVLNRPRHPPGKTFAKGQLGQAGQTSGWLSASHAPLGVISDLQRDTSSFGVQLILC